MSNQRRYFCTLVLSLCLVATAMGQGVRQSANDQPSAKRAEISQRESQDLVIKRVQPAYPPLARQARVQGTVLLEAEISQEGTVENLRLISGHPMLVATAIDAVKQWRYKPYLLNGRAVEVRTQVAVNFTLSGPSPTSVSQDQQDSANGSAERAQYDEQLKLAMADWKNNKAEEAIEIAAKLIKSDPKRWEGYGLAGAIERAMNNVPEAKAAYQRALDLAPAGDKPQIRQAMQEIEKDTNK